MISDKELTHDDLQQDLDMILVSSWTNNIEMNKLIAMMADADTDAVSIEADDNDDREDS